MPGLLVATIANLHRNGERSSAPRSHRRKPVERSKDERWIGWVGERRAMTTYRRHRDLALEPPSDPIVDTLGLSPVRRHTLVGIALMSIEALGVYFTLRSAPNHPSGAVNDPDGIEI